MSRYLEKYKGTYRVKAFYDISTNDYPRVFKDGRYIIDPSFDDLYIPCKGGNYIMHHQRNVLIAIISSVGKGHNIIKSLFDDIYGESTSKGIAYEDLYNTLIKEGIITKVEETDKEMLIYFPDNNMKLFASLLKPSTNGKGTSVFSTKNLFKSKYTISENAETEYKKITSGIDKMSAIKKYNNEFLETLSDNYKSNMKKSGLKCKEYIHSIGKWDEYLEFLKKRIE